MYSDNMEMLCVDNIHAFVFFRNLSEYKEYSYYQICKLHSM